MGKSDLIGNCCEELRNKMGLGKRCGSDLSEGLGLGFVRYTRSMSGKRIAISSNMEVDSTVSPQKMKKQWSEKMNSSSDKSLLEAMPQDILVMILCGVGHEDLKQLFHVSKQIREATLVAKKMHFEYSTPTKSLAFRNSIDLGDVEKDFEEIEAPNAPKQIRTYRSRLRGKKLADISVALFSSPDEEQWPRKDLFTKMEIEI
ncbi:F-box protein [Actinidia chinensis var. chinensis]|uniref:F-box protein n=1 Tax=Actinidia chinensis var. chinensis TaxID=1590841 RepID=A0A2R6RAV1_ACTCC|nr:F-box protein [Actinidia chinensis var. chinensis]